jgi:hypothetical protein
MVRTVPASRHAPRPDWGLLAVAVVLVGGMVGVLLALLGISP